MSSASLTAEIIVPMFGTICCVTPAVSRPTVQFGVRIPGDRARAAVIRHQRRAYYWRTGTVDVCCTVAAVIVSGFAPWWPPRLILVLEMAADLGCFLMARNAISSVKNAEGWFAGRKQVVATDTSWRFNRPNFPVLWLVPALTVMAATVIIGVLRYHDLPANLAIGFNASGGPVRWAPKSPVSAFFTVAGQLYVTVLWTGVLLIIYRSRPDIEAPEAVASTRRYRGFLAALTRAMLTLVALVDLSLLLTALRNWQVYRLSGIRADLPALPFIIGVIMLAAVSLRAGQAGSRLARGNQRQVPATVDATGSRAAIHRDDDRFWKAGLFYVNRDDPAIMVGRRFGIGWTFNFGNPTAWLILAAIVAAPAGLAAIHAAAGM